MKNYDEDEKAHLGYLPCDSPRKAIKRADSFLTKTESYCIAIVCSQYPKIKQSSGNFLYNNLPVQQFIIVGKLRKYYELQNQFGRIYYTLQIQDETGKININVLKLPEEKGEQWQASQVDLISTMLRVNKSKSLKEVIGKYLRIGFYIKKSFLKKQVTHVCFTLQLVTDFDVLTNHRLQVIKDQCKSIHF